MADAPFPESEKVANRFGLVRILDMFVIGVKMDDQGEAVQPFVVTFGFELQSKLTFKSANRIAEFAQSEKSIDDSTNRSISEVTSDFGGIVVFCLNKKTPISVVLVPVASASIKLG